MQESFGKNVNDIWLLLITHTHSLSHAHTHIRIYTLEKKLHTHTHETYNIFLQFAFFLFFSSFFFYYFFLFCQIVYNFLEIVSSLFTNTHTHTHMYPLYTRTGGIYLFMYRLYIEKDRNKHTSRTIII